MLELVNARIVMVEHLRLLRMQLVFLHLRSLSGKLWQCVYYPVYSCCYRPDLTWRDIQHLCVRSAKLINPDDPDWEILASGRRFSYKYGFGVIDASAYVEAAQDWELVKPQTWVEMSPIQLQEGTMDATGEMSGGEPIVSGGVRSSYTITRDLLDENNFDALEHVTVTVWISHTRRGDVEVSLLSPNGVKSVLAATRKFDNDGDGFPGWTFMSLKHWFVSPFILQSTNVTRRIQGRKPRRGLDYTSLGPE